MSGLPLVDAHAYQAWNVRSNDVHLEPGFFGYQLYASAQIQSTVLGSGYHCSARWMSTPHALGHHTNAALFAPRDRNRVTMRFHAALNTSGRIAWREFALPSISQNQRISTGRRNLRTPSARALMRRSWLPLTIDRALVGPQEIIGMRRFATL